MTTLLFAWLYGFLLGVLAGPSLRFLLRWTVRPLNKINEGITRR